MWRQRLRIFFHNKLAVASVVFLFLTIAACFLVPVLHPTIRPIRRPLSACPGTPHPRGTIGSAPDSSGFDELGRIFYGGEYSLTLGSSPFHHDRRRYDLRHDLRLRRWHY